MLASSGSPVVGRDGLVVKSVEIASDSQQPRVLHGVGKPLKTSHHGVETGVGGHALPLDSLTRHSRRVGKLGEIVVAENIGEACGCGCPGLDVRVGIDVGRAGKFAVQAGNQVFGHGNCWGSRRGHRHGDRTGGLQRRVRSLPHAAVCSRPRQRPMLTRDDGVRMSSRSAR